MMYFDLIILVFVIALICYITVFINKVTIYDDPMILKLKSDLIQVDERVKFINFYASNQSFT
jgi:hypothetical protein